MVKQDSTTRARTMLRSKKLLFASLWAENKFYDGYQYWYPSFKKLFNNIISFDPQKNARIYGREEMNKRLFDLVKKEKPDYIFMWIVGYEFYIDTLVKIRKILPKTRILGFFSDDDTQFDNFSIYYSLFFDYNLALPQPNQYYKKFGIKNVFYTVGKNFDNYKPLNLKKEYDITFIGTPKADRCKLVSFLLKNKVNLKLFGWGWHNHPEFKRVYHGPLNTEDLIKTINKSRINLCFSKNMYNKPHLVGRVFEIGACKSFILLENVPIYKKFFTEGKEIIMFSSAQDLLKKIKYYLKNEQEREEIAENMHQRTIKNYNLNQDLANLFAMLEKIKKPSYAGLPAVKKKIFNINKKQLNLPINNLKKMLIGFDYISFSTSNCELLKYKNLLQAYSLEKSGKKISCCDYIVASKFIGDFLLFDSKTAFTKLPRKDFSRFINISQLMLDKKYFFSNIPKIKALAENKETDIINEKNTIFVSTPLVRINQFKKEKYDVLLKAFQMIFIEKLYPFAYQKKIFSSSYPYKLFFYSLAGKFFILKHLFKFIYNRKRFDALISAYKDNRY